MNNIPYLRFTFNIDSNFDDEFNTRWNMYKNINDSLNQEIGHMIHDIVKNNCHRIFTYNKNINENSEFNDFNEYFFDIKSAAFSCSYSVIIYFSSNQQNPSTEK